MKKARITLGSAALIIVSGTFQMAVASAPSATVLTLSAPEVESNLPVTMTATITPGVATGLVSFLEGSTILGSATINLGVATFTTNQLQSGSLTLRAIYQGDINYEASVSSPVNLDVTLIQSGQIFPALSLNTGPGRAFVASGDFNGDSIRDAVAVSEGAGTVTLILGTGGGMFLQSTPISGLTSPEAITSGDFNQDGNLDLAVSNSLDLSIMVYLGNGDGTFQTGTRYATTGASFGILAGDFDGDGVPDLGTENGADGVDFFHGVGDGTFSPKINTPINGNMYAVGKGDFNGDGKADLAVVVNSTNSVAVLLGSYCGFYPVYYAVGRQPVQIAIADFNEDGEDDLAVLNSQDKTVGILSGNGDGTFQAQAVVSYLDGTGLLIASGDLDGDGNQDLLVSDTTGLAAVIGKGTGLFFDPHYEIPFAFGLSSMQINEFDQDGMNDVVVGSSGFAGFLGGGPMVLTVKAGSAQSAVVTNPFAVNLQTQFLSFGRPGSTDESSITFSAPSSGPSGYFTGIGTSAEAAQREDGSAQAPVFVANDASGSFEVTATSQGSETTFELQNVAATSGPTTCSYTVSPGVLVFNSDGGSAMMTVTPNALGCTWSATGDRDWLGVFGSNIIGAGTISVTVPANLSGSKRMGTVLIAGQYVTAIQWSTAPVLTDMPEGTPFAATSTSMIGFGFSSGCNSSPLEYCPDSPLTRAQAAVFVIRGVYGNDNFSYSNTPHFSDVAAVDFGFAWIQKLYELGITAGCGGGNYCPDQQITRDQAAVLVIRARLGSWTNFSSPSTPYFTDVPADYWAFRFIQRLRFENITSGCGGGNFCPGRPITRGEMGAFIVRGLTDEFLPAGMPVVTQISDPIVNPFQELTLKVTGADTHFDPQNTSLVAMPGLTFSNIIVSSPTNLTVHVAVDGLAPLDIPESIIAITGNEEAVIPNAIRIQGIP